MALPALIQNTDQTKISEILQENNSYLEEIQTIIEAEYSVVNDNSDILNNQLEILEDTATRDRLDADNEEMRAKRLEDKIGGVGGRDTAPSASAAAADGGMGGLFSKLFTGAGLAGLTAAFAPTLAAGLSSALRGGGLIALSDMFGDSIGSFLGENVGQVLGDLGVDPAFATKMDTLLTERTGSMMAAGGWSKLLFGKARYGIIADGVAGFLGLGSLSDPNTIEEISNKIEEYTSPVIADMFDTAADTVKKGGEGLFAGSMIGGFFGKKGRVVGALAGFLTDYFDLTGLADPEKRDEIMDNVGSTFESMLNPAAALGVGGVGAYGAYRGVTSIKGLAGPSAVAADVPTGTSPTKADRAASVRSASASLSDKKLADSGLKRVGTGARSVIQRTNGQIASHDDILKAAEKSAIKKFPRIAKLLRFPGIGSIIAIGEVLVILNDDSTTIKQKAAALAVVLGGVGGSVLGAIAGGMIGAPGGFLALVTAGVGGLGGYFAGETIARHIAEFLLGMTNEKFEDLTRAVGQAFESQIGMPAAPTLGSSTDSNTPSSSATPGSSATSMLYSQTSSASAAAAGALEASSAAAGEAGALEASRSSVSPGSVNISSPDSVRIITSVNTNQITDRALALESSSGNVNIMQPIQNVTNVTNNNTSVGGGGGGATNQPAGRGYNIDGSFNSQQKQGYS